MQKTVRSKLANVVLLFLIALTLFAPISARPSYAGNSASVGSGSTGG